jgi:hypothetical protein
MSILSDIFGGDNSSGNVLRELERNRQLYENLQTPTYDEYNPELYDNETANYTLTQDDPVMRSKQLEALAQFDDLAHDGLSDIDKAAFAKAKNVANQEAKARTDATIADAQARGVAGGGMEFALRQGGDQAALQRANEAALQQSSAAAQQRQLALQAYANQAGNIRGQDYQKNKGNTDVINQFNMANTQSRNATNQANVNAKNSAFQYNQGMKTQDYNNQLAKINGQTGANSQIANAYAAQGAAEQSDRNALLGLGATLGGAWLARPSADSGQEIESKSQGYGRNINNRIVY